MSVSWPFPQVFKGKGVILIADKSTVYEATAGPHYGLMAPAIYNAGDPDTISAIAEGGPWHFIDMHGAWMLLNGQSAVLRARPDALNPSFGNKWYGRHSFHVNTGCYHRGRVLFGGFNEVDHPVWGRLDPNVVAWSHIGGGDGFYPFFDELIRTDRGDGTALRDLQRLDSGYVYIDSYGEVLRTIPMGRHVIAYGSHGVSRLTPSTVKAGVTVDTYGSSPLLDIGIVGRGAAAGDDLQQLCLGEDGHLYRIRGSEAGPQVEDLGYEEYFASMLGGTDEVVIAYDHQPRNRDFYICASDEGFVLSKTGLGKVSSVVTSLIYDNGLKGFTSSQSVSSQFTTDQFDLGLRSIKHIQMIHIGFTDVTTPMLRVDYKYNTNTTWSYGAWKTVNAEGFVAPAMSGVDFRLAFKGTFGANAKVDYMQMMWHGPDKRGIRGRVEPARTVGAR